LIQTIITIKTKFTKENIDRNGDIEIR